jgi:hypothetical protein
MTRHPYRGTSLMRNNASLGPYSMTMPRALWWSWGGGSVSYERGAPVEGLHGLQPPSLLRAPQPRGGGARVKGFPEFWEAKSTKQFSGIDGRTR